MNKWQKPLLQEEEPDVKLKVWEAILYPAVLVVVVFVALSKI
jgi:type II secretory pathway component PulF